jgi:hypothetical protein
VPSEVEQAVDEGDLDRAAAALRPYDFQFLVTVDQAEKERPLAPRTIRLRVVDVIPKPVRVLASYALMGLYFGLLGAGRRGQTLGKRLVGIRVARLDGHRLSLLESVERFAGYLHIPGSLGLSLLDLWRDPNRRMAHDRVAHTAVVRVARAKKAPAPGAGAGGGPPAEPARTEEPSSAAAS